MTKPRSCIPCPAEIFNASVRITFRKISLCRTRNAAFFLFDKHYIVDKARLAYPYRDCEDGFFRIDV